MTLFKLVCALTGFALLTNALALEKADIIGKWEGSVESEIFSHKDTDPTLDFVEIFEDGRIVMASKGPGDGPSMKMQGGWEIRDAKLYIKFPGDKSANPMEVDRNGDKLRLHEKGSGTFNLRLMTPESASVDFTQDDMKVALLLRSLHYYYEGVDEKVKGGQKVEHAKETLSIPISSREAKLEELVGLTNIVRQLQVELGERREQGLGVDHPEVLWIERLIRGLESKPKQAEQGGARQPATAPDSKSEGSEKPKPESEGRSR